MSTSCCPYCPDKAYGSKNALNIHLQQYHAKSFTFVIDVEGIKRQITIKRSSKGYRCPFCVEIFTSTPDAVSHLNRKLCFINDTLDDAVLEEFNKFNDELLNVNDNTEVLKTMSSNHPLKRFLHFLLFFNILVVLLVITVHVLDCTHIMYVHDNEEETPLMLLSFRSNCFLPSLSATFKDFTADNSLLLPYFFGLHLAFILYFYLF